MSAYSPIYSAPGDIYFRTRTVSILSSSVVQRIQKGEDNSYSFQQQLRDLVVYIISRQSRSSLERLSKDRDLWKDLSYISSYKGSLSSSLTDHGS